MIFFGLYPIVKYFAEKPKKPWVQLMIKCGFCLVVSIAALAGFSELVLGDMNLPEWFPEYGKRIITLSSRSEMTARGIRLVKDVWTRMQVER